MDRARSRTDDDVMTLPHPADNLWPSITLSQFLHNNNPDPLHPEVGFWESELGRSHLNQMARIVEGHIGRAPRGD